MINGREEFVEDLQKQGKSNNQIILKMDKVLWALKQGYRKPLENWCEAMEKLFQENLIKNP